MTDVVMPRLSDTMEEGTILRWLKHDGEQVARGEELVEIETDKASMIYESDREGTLQTVASEGDTLAVGELIARIGDGTAAGAHDAQIGQGTAAGAHEAPSADAQAQAESSHISGTDAAEQEMHPEQATVGTDAADSPSANGGPERSRQATSARVRASPLARRIARESGVDLAGLSGSGPGGRIVKADVQAQAGAPNVEPAGMAATAPMSTEPEVPVEPAPAGERARAPTADVSAAKGQTTAVELSRTQRTIARRMAESKATIPDFSLTAEVDMERCVELRAELKRLARGAAAGASSGTSEGETDTAVVPTYNDMIVKACALALREHPRANGSYRDGRFELHSRVNIGVAVAADSGEATSGVLVVPTVFDADAKALGEIARETRTLARRVRNGQITPPELGGATFTVSNLGMYGIRQFSAIVNPPQAAILAVGEVAPRPVTRKKKVVVRATMTVTLSCDHRILYGADAARFLARVRELLEEPAALTL
ncbi:MAG TPA: dihydrolipoamide acetyltransferase family protein [Solirubrobacteraceae bacterium]|jgi:pyruvate dehydrogenase E2 component (dihydrolipoamide acetyltransferase)|nr:dihydrolipoamide acetyltransferase family protein [Solirubrobacteraceae bacterium]